MNYHRNLINRIIETLQVSPILLLTGARQTGKTTIMKMLAEKHNLNYFTFDNLTLLSAAQSDPMGFIGNLAKPAILDEVQRVPEIALPIKMNVDNTNTPGMHALTGSANPLAVPKLNDSLAGRMIILNLYPLSQGELKNIQESFIDDIFSHSWKPKAQYPAWSQEEMSAALVKGGYPRMQALSATMRQEWCNSHLLTILERDVQDLTQMGKIKELPRLIHFLALRAGQTINVSELSRITSIPYANFNSYMNILEALYLVTRQPAWHNNKSQRLIKMPKLYLSDTGLLCHLIGVDEHNLLNNPTQCGHILENFIAQELHKQNSWSSSQVSLYHLRTYIGAKVDIVLENKQGHVVGVEVKRSLTIKEQDFKGLKLLAQEAGNKFSRGIVLYPGSDVIPFGDNLFALPITSLWTK